MARRRKRAHNAGTLVAPRIAGGPWAIQYSENGRRRYRGGFEDKATAQRVLNMMAGEVAQGRTPLPPTNRNAETLEVEALALLTIRDTTHVAADQDRNRWKNHLGPFFGHLKPQAITKAKVKAFIEAKRIEGVNPATIRIFVSFLRVLFQRLVDEGKVTANPVLALGKADKALYRPTHDPATTPFLETLDQVQAVYQRLPEPFNVAFAVGALAGLRTGEVFGLEWSSVDLKARRIQVRQQISRRKGEAFKRLKDKDSRPVPILDALLPILEAWKLKTGGQGLVIPSARVDGNHVGKGIPGPVLGAVLTELGLNRPGLGWYECTRHTFASHWVMHGGSLEKLKEMLGHYSVVITETHYVHLKPEMFTPKDLGTIPLVLNQKPATVGRIAPAAAAAKPGRKTGQARGQH